MGVLFHKIFCGCLTFLGAFAIWEHNINEFGLILVAFGGHFSALRYAVKSKD